MEYVCRCLCVQKEKTLKTVFVSYLNERFLMVLRLAKFAKLFVWSDSPFWWWWRRCVCELTFSFSKLKDPARDPVFSNAAMSNIVVNSDGFWYMCVILIFLIYWYFRFYQQRRKICSTFSDCLRKQKFSSQVSWTKKYLWL